MIRVAASELRFSAHATQRLGQRANGFSREKIAAAVLERLRVGDFKLSERTGSLWVCIDGGLAIAVELDDGPLRVLTVVAIEMAA